MRALIDTSAFLWWVSNSDALSIRARQVVGDADNDILFSAASAWEIAIKLALGKLAIKGSPERYVADRMRRHRFQPLPIEVRHALRVASLPRIHTDPFDRILIAQSQLEDLPIVTSDPAIGRYDVDVIW